MCPHRKTTLPVVMSMILVAGNVMAQSVTTKPIDLHDGNAKSGSVRLLLLPEEVRHPFPGHSRYSTAKGNLELEYSRFGGAGTQTLGSADQISDEGVRTISGPAVARSEIAGRYAHVARRWTSLRLDAESRLGFELLMGVAHANWRSITQTTTLTEPPIEKGANVNGLVVGLGLRYHITSGLELSGRFSTTWLNPEITPADVVCFILSRGSSLCPNSDNFDTTELALSYRLLEPLVLRAGIVMQSLDHGSSWVSGGFVSNSPVHARLRGAFFGLNIDF